jgi:hypothetical protein
MREDELRRQIAELVADHADQATQPPLDVIRRRGRRRRARLASGAVLLLAAVAAGLVAVQRLPERQIQPRRWPLSRRRWSLNPPYPSAQVPALPTTYDAGSGTSWGP